MDIKSQILKALEECMIVLLNQRNLKFFGTVIYGLEIFLVEEHEAKQMGINGKCYAYTDGKSIYIIVCSLHVNKGDLLFSLIHEALHIISLHITRRNGRDPEIWQMATDHVVNSLIKKLCARGQITWDPNCIYYPEIEDEYPEATVEFVYELLKPKSPPPQQPKQNKNNPNKSPSPSNGNGDPEDGDDEEDQNKQSNTKTEKIQMPNGQTMLKVKDTNGNFKFGLMDCDPGNNAPGKPLQKLSQECEEIKRKGKMAWEIQTKGMGKGSLPAELLTYLDEVFKVDLHWTKILKSAILYSVQGLISRTWVRMNYYMPIGIRTPGKRKQRENLKWLIVCADSSGSIGDDDLKVFCGIIGDLAKYFYGVIILVHDVIVHVQVELENPSEDEIYKQLSKIKGRGGTAHTDAFNKIEQEYKNKEISSVVFLTDFMSNVQDIYQNYKFMKNIQTIWVLNYDIEVNLDGVRYKTCSILGKKPKRISLKRT